MNDDLLKWLQDWYAARCYGDWEHEFGINIRTLDNPGCLQVGAPVRPLHRHQLAP